MRFSLVSPGLCPCLCFMCTESAFGPQLGRVSEMLIGAIVGVLEDQTPYSNE